MSANGIAHLATREERQQAKLDLAANDRQASAAFRAGITADRRYQLDITELPTQYSGNSAIDNPNSGGLVIGRPWTIPTGGVVYHLILAEDGTPLSTEAGDWITQI